MAFQDRTTTQTVYVAQDKSPAIEALQLAIRVAAVTNADNCLSSATEVENSFLLYSLDWETLANRNSLLSTKTCGITPTTQGTRGTQSNGSTWINSKSRRGYTMVCWDGGSTKERGSLVYLC